MGAQKHFPGARRADLLDQLEVGLHVADRGFLRLHRRRHQRHVATAERTIDERLLPVAGGLQHRVPDPAEGQADVEAGDRQIPQDRGRERAVFAVAVVGGRAGLRGVGDQGVGRGRLDLAQTCGDRAGCSPAALAPHLADEGIVAAGVQDEQPEPPGAVGRRHQTLQRNGFVIGVAVAGKAGIDRYQIVVATDLQTVAGVINHRNISLIRLVLEFSDRPLELEIADIDQHVDGIEAGVPEHPGDRVGVAGRVGQLRNTLIGRIADHQRHALVRQSAPWAKTIVTMAIPIVAARRWRRLIIQNSARAACRPCRSFPNIRASIRNGCFEIRGRLPA